MTIPHHKSLRAGAQSAILRDVAEHLDIPRQTLVDYSLSGDNTVCCQCAKDKEATPSVLGKPNQHTVLTPGC